MTGCKALIKNEINEDQDLIKVRSLQVYILRYEKNVENLGREKVKSSNQNVCKYQQNIGHAAKDEMLGPVL